MTVQPGEAKAKGGTHQCVQVSERRVWDESGFFQWRSVPGQEAPSKGAQEVPSEHQEILFYCGGDWPLAQVGQSGGGVSNIADIQKPIWTWSWATGSSWPCLGRGVGQDGLQSFLINSTSLWFCNPVCSSDEHFLWHCKLFTKEKIFVTVPLEKYNAICKGQRSVNLCKLRQLCGF